jgi:hypothetical protein
MSDTNQEQLEIFLTYYKTCKYLKTDFQNFKPPSIPQVIMLFIPELRIKILHEEHPAASH